MGATASKGSRRRSKKSSKVGTTTATLYNASPALQASVLKGSSSSNPIRRESFVKQLPPPVLVYDVKSDSKGNPTGWEIVMWNFHHPVPENFIKLAIDASLSAKQTKEPAHFTFVFSDMSRPTTVVVFPSGTSAQGQDRFSMYCSSNRVGEPETADSEELRLTREALQRCQEELAQYKLRGAEKREGPASLLEAERELDDYKLQLIRAKEDMLASQAKWDEMEKEKAKEMAASQAKWEEMAREKAKEYERINEEIKAASTAKTQFLATMSHEIRTPLSVVIATTNLLANSNMTTEQAEMVHSIRSCGEYLLVLVNNILDVSKLEASLLVLDQSEFSLKTTMEEAMDIMAQDARRKKIDMVFDVAPEVPPLLIGDPFRLRQVLINLLSNATKFTQEGGSVFFSAQLVDPVDESGHCTLQLNVTDTGVGIPPDGHSKLFQIFTQYDASTTRKFGGSGLGLAISKRLVEMMSGNIWFESVPNRGTTFYFTIRVKVVQPHIAAPTPFCLLGAMWYKNQEWPDIVAIAKSDHLQHVIKAKLSRPQAHTFSRSNLDNCTELFDKTKKQVFMIDEDLWQEAPKAKKLEILQSNVEGVVLMGFEAKAERADKKSKPGLNRVSFLRKPFKDVALAECVANCIGQTINEVKKNVVTVCPLAAKIKRNVLCAVKYPLRILVADDNKMILQVMKKSLGMLGYEDVKTVENGKLALDEISTTPYDVILMDMQMPVMDGCEAAQQIRLTHNIPCHIIALTANAFTEDRERCIAAGMCSYMSKPVRMDVLKQELKLAYKELRCEFSTCICKMTAESHSSSPKPQAEALSTPPPVPSDPATN